MGYRPTIVTEFKCDYGTTLSGYNYGFDEFSDFLDTLGVEHFPSDREDEHEINSKQLIALESKIQTLVLNEAERDNLQELIKIAKNAEYAKNGFVKVHWF